ncbi:MAG TPA: ribosome-associated translation inhibitor RaiA [Patescibacteria group bacterium]|nr:ribosome-associated translation inhibitor RaiA [Patescibacteria group bacterium]
MEFKYFLQNVKLTSNDKEEIRKKLNKLNKYAVDIWEAKLDLSYNESHNTYERFRIEVNLKLPNKLIRSEEREANLQDGLDKVVDELGRQIRKYKGYKESRRRKARRKAKKGEF